VLTSEQVEAREQSTKGPSLDEPGDIKQMLNGILAVIQQSNTKLQESVKADLSANNEKIQKFEERVTADISSVRNDIKAEHEKLIKIFELQIQEAKKEVSAKLDSRGPEID
jgi:gas vesicle protein